MVWVYKLLFSLVGRYVIHKFGVSLMLMITNLIAVLCNVLLFYHSDYSPHLNIIAIWVLYVTNPRIIIIQPYTDTVIMRLGWKNWRVPVNISGLFFIGIGQLICKMFRDAYRAENMPYVQDDIINVFPKAEAREFVLRTCVGRPYPYSQSGPQRMYCRISDNEFRVASAFTIDKQFL